MHSLLDAVLTLLKYFGLLFGTAMAAVLALVGSYAALSSYIAGRKRRRVAAQALRDWADVAFPAVEWDRERQCYFTKAERAELAQQPEEVVGPPAQAQQTMPPIVPVAAKKQSSRVPTPPRPSEGSRSSSPRRQWKHGFEQRCR